MTNTTETATLEVACRQAANGLANALSTRKMHPTYGITKNDLRQRLARLEGLLFAFKAVAAGDNSPMFESQADAGAADLGINIHSLRLDVESA